MGHIIDTSRNYSEFDAALMCKSNIISIHLPLWEFWLQKDTFGPTEILIHKNIKVQEALEITMVLKAGMLDQASNTIVVSIVLTPKPIQK